jgi:hypothetical protein
MTAEEWGVAIRDAVASGRLDPRFFHARDDAA